MTSASRNQELGVLPTDESDGSFSDAPKTESAEYIETKDDPDEHDDDHPKLASLTSTLLLYIIGGNLMLVSFYIPIVTKEKFYVIWKIHIQCVSMEMTQSADLSVYCSATHRSPEVLLRAAVIDWSFLFNVKSLNTTEEY